MEELALTWTIDSTSLSHPLNSNKSSLCWAGCTHEPSIFVPSMEGSETKATMFTIVPEVVAIGNAMRCFDWPKYWSFVVRV